MSVPVHQPVSQLNSSPIPAVPHNQQVVVLTAGVGQRPFRFDGGAGSYLGMSILAALVTIFTAGICTPWAICMRYGWRTNHTLVYGHRLRFTGSAWSLFGHWIKWWALCLITIGIYGFWVVPRLTRWIVEHQEFVD